MRDQIQMPKLSSDMEKGVLVSWNVALEEPFKAGDTLFEIEAKKVVSEVIAVRDGVVKAFLVEEGEEVEAGCPVMEVCYQAGFAADSNEEDI